MRFSHVSPRRICGSRVAEISMNDADVAERDVIVMVALRLSEERKRTTDTRRVGYVRGR
jgi:hypothetical protein